MSSGVSMKGRWLGLTTEMVTLDVPVNPSLSVAVRVAVYVPSASAANAMLDPVPEAYGTPFSSIVQEYAYPAAVTAVLGSVAEPLRSIVVPAAGVVVGAPEMLTVGAM